MKKNKKNKQQINYLDLIPVRPEKLGWHIDRRERVVLEVKNEGFFNRIAQTYFRRPQTTKVHLDVQGSYLWPLIDGERTVMELAALQKEHFGEAAEPLYPRIVKSFQILESYHFISFKNSVKATCQSIIIFSLNSLLVTSLKAGGVIEYNAKTVDDEFFFQSLGRLFVNQDLPNIIYRLLEKVNFVEVIFILVLSSILSKILVVNLMRTILLTLGIYLFGTIIYICFMYFIELLFN